MFYGLGVPVDGVKGLWRGAIWLFWVWAFDINIRGITLGMRLVLHFQSYIKFKITAAVEYC